MDVISLNPVEQKRLPHIRNQIITRDRYTTFPLVVNGKLEGINYFGKANYGAVHHITPMAFLKRHGSLVDPNHPLNLITIDYNSHAMLHREWVDYYGKNPELIKEMVLERGARGWVNEYDDVLTGMTIIRSHDHIIDNPDFFPEYQDEIESHYEFLDQDFVDRYRWFSWINV